MTRERIVSSQHLVSEQAAELSEYEYGLIVAGNAFNRWMVRCMAVAGYPDFNSTDVLVLHTVNHRGREKRLTDIGFTLNIDDAHIVNYALKKLLKAGLVQAEKRGKERFYRTSTRGREVCQRYREVRDACLVDAFAAMGPLEKGAVSAAAQRLRALSGLYDQAARAATSY
ncbi:MAG: winged helix DNA-binding protein [Acidihalobacter sp.]